MPTSINTNQGQILDTATTSALVYVARTLGDLDNPAALPEPYLRCDALRTCCGPEIDEATLSYVYGEICQDDANPKAFATFDPRDLNGKFCKITFSSFPPFVWYGIIEVTQTRAGGAAKSTPDGPTVPMGRQTLTAYGLLRLLERCIVRTAVVRQTDAGGNPTSITIGRGIPFNTDTQGQLVSRGNRSDTTDTGAADGVYLFSDEPAGKAEWTAWEAVRYLLKYHSPADNEGLRLNDWELVGADPTPAAGELAPIAAGDPAIGSFAPQQPGALDWYEIDVATDGKNVKDLLDKLVDRRRGVGYYVAWNALAARVEVRTFTFLDAPFTLPGGGQLAANPTSYSLDFESAFDIVDSVVTDTIASQYDRVIAQGAFKTSTCTLQLDPGSSQLVADWTDDEQQAYLDGANGASGYAGWDTERKQLMNAIARGADAVAHVFAQFAVSAYWTRRVYDPEQSIPRPEYWAAPPTIDGTPEPNYDADTNPAGEPLWLAGSRFEKWLPLYERLDYSGDAIESGLAGQRAGLEFLKPFVIALTAPASATAAAVWEYGDRLGLGAKLEQQGRRWSVHVAPLDRGPRIELRVQGGPQHMLAAGIFTASSAAAFDESDDPGKQAGLWFGHLRATLCLRLDSRVSADATVAGVIVTETAQERILVIDVDDARLDFVVPGTVVAVTNGALVKSDFGGYVRDDRPRLENIAAAAAQWYGRERQTLQLTYRQIAPLVPLGGLITDVGATFNKTNINTVVTAIAYDLLAVTTRIETSYAALDFQ